MSKPLPRPKSRRRLPGEPPHGAPPVPSVDVRQQTSQKNLAAKKRIELIRREARALAAPFRKTTRTIPHEAAPKIIVHSNVVVRQANRVPTLPPLVPITPPLLPGLRGGPSALAGIEDHVDSAYLPRNKNRERLDWAVAHALELFPNPAQPRPPQDESATSGRTVQQEVADHFAARPNWRDWPTDVVDKARRLRPPEFPEGKRCRRLLLTSTGRRVHVTLP